MKKYESLEELRKNIDEIDLKILDLIEKRKDLVTKVVSVKKRDQIIDQKRIEFILNKLSAIEYLSLTEEVSLSLTITRIRSESIPTLGRLNL